MSATSKSACEVPLPPSPRLGVRKDDIIDGVAIAQPSIEKAPTVQVRDDIPVSTHKPGPANISISTTNSSHTTNLGPHEERRKSSHDIRIPEKAGLPRAHNSANDTVKQEQNKAGQSTCKGKPNNARVGDKQQTDVFPSNEEKALKLLNAFGDATASSVRYDGRPLDGSSSRVRGHDAKNIWVAHDEAGRSIKVDRKGTPGSLKGVVTTSVRGSQEGKSQTATPTKTTRPNYTPPHRRYAAARTAAASETKTDETATSRFCACGHRFSAVDRYDAIVQKHFAECAFGKTGLLSHAPASPQQKSVKTDCGREPWGEPVIKTDTKSDTKPDDQWTIKPPTKLESNAEMRPRSAPMEKPQSESKFVPEQAEANTNQTKLEDKTVKGSEQGPKLPPKKTLKDSKHRAVEPVEKSSDRQTQPQKVKHPASKIDCTSKAEPLETAAIPSTPADATRKDGGQARPPARKKTRNHTSRAPEDAKEGGNAGKSRKGAQPPASKSKRVDVSTTQTPAPEALPNPALASKEVPAIISTTSSSPPHTTRTNTPITASIAVPTTAPLPKPATNSATTPASAHLPRTALPSLPTAAPPTSSAPLDPTITISTSSLQSLLRTTVESAVESALARLVLYRAQDQLYQQLNPPGSEIQLGDLWIPPQQMHRAAREHAVRGDLGAGGGGGGGERFGMGNPGAMGMGMGLNAGAVEFMPGAAGAYGGATGIYPVGGNAPMHPQNVYVAPYTYTPAPYLPSTFPAQAPAPQAYNTAIRPPAPAPTPTNTNPSRYHTPVDDTEPSQAEIDRYLSGVQRINAIGEGLEREYGWQGMESYGEGLERRKREGDGKKEDKGGIGAERRARRF